MAPGAAMPTKLPKRDGSLLPLMVSAGGIFVSDGHDVLSGGMHSSWCRPEGMENAVVLGFDTSEETNMIDICAGKVHCARWMACARNKLWWMTPEWGTRVEELPPETQFLLLDHSGRSENGAHGDSGGPYSLLLPLLDGTFRGTLRAERDRQLRARSDDLILRLDSGAPDVAAKSWPSALLVASGSDVYALIERGVAMAAQLSGAGRPLSEKQLPESLNYFGWCTWDAFYSNVSAKGIREGLDSLCAGGVAPRTLIIDDGWQMTEVDDDFAEAVTTKALRRLRVAVTDSMDDDFAEAEMSVLASYADDLPGGSDLAAMMPALADSEYGETVRESLRSRDGAGEPSSEAARRMLRGLGEMRRKGNVAVPEIERTVLQLAKRPQDSALWSRLLARVGGWLLGLFQVMFLSFYQFLVDPAAPYSWPVSSFEYLATGPFRGPMLTFFKASSDFTRRIISVKANGKFAHPAAGPDQRNWFAEAEDFRAVTSALRADFGVLFIYAWHGLPAYWGGVMPEGAEFADLKPRIEYPVPTAGLREIEPAMLWNPAVLAGIGVVEDPATLYARMHRYLGDSGVDGVKVDCQAGIGLVGSVLGGGPKAARRFHAALEASVAAHFPGNHAINCMCHSTENMYQLAGTAVARASDDFYPRETASSTPHVAACAYNSLFLSPLVQPDWDMFQSAHPAAHLHAAARAVSGGPVYVSDKVGRHDFGILRRLVLRDGSVLRAARPGLPTPDSIFRDPLRDRTSLLKVFNVNAASAVVGVFHLQGYYWCRLRRRFATVGNPPAALSAVVGRADVPPLAAVAAAAPAGATGRFAALRCNDGSVQLLAGPADVVAVTLQPGEAEIVTLTATVALGEGPDAGEFAPLGLANMMNSGGAVLAWRADCGGALQEVDIRGEGDFVALASQPPVWVEVDDQRFEPGAPRCTWEDGRLHIDVQAHYEQIKHVVRVRF